MTRKLRYVAAFLFAVSLLVLLYFGSFLPFKKSRKYIAARQAEVRSFQEFDAVYDGVLDYYSPVGQEEIVNNYLEILSVLIDRESREKNPNKLIVKELVERAEKRAGPIIEKGVGFGFSQLIFSLANVYRSATIVLQGKEYYDKALNLYILGDKYSPNRRIFLYNIFDMYRFGGDNENAKKIGARIFEIYKDERIKQIVSEL